MEGFTTEELHKIWQLAQDKLKEINESGLSYYVQSSLPSIRNKVTEELKRRGEWEE